LFTVLNLKARSVPRYDRPIRVVLSFFLMQHPTKFTVSPTHSSFCLEWTPCGDRLSPLLEEHSDIVRMDAGGPFPPVEFFHRLSKKFAPGAIEEIEGAVWRRCVDQSGG
jgi:hypothetical protein